MRWLIKLSNILYVVERIVWAELLTRWSLQLHQCVKSKSVAQLQDGYARAYNFWFDLEVGLAISERHHQVSSSKWWTTSGSCNNENGVWISVKDNLLKLRIIVATYIALGDLWSFSVTAGSMQAHFHLVELKDDVGTFSCSYLLCLCTQTGTVVPRPLGRALLVTKKSQLLHFKFCYMSHGEDDFKDVMVLKDDHSGYVWLTSTKKTTAEVVSDVLVFWIFYRGSLNRFSWFSIHSIISQMLAVPLQTVQ